MVEAALKTNSLVVGQGFLACPRPRSGGPSWPSVQGSAEHPPAAWPWVRGCGSVGCVFASGAGWEACCPATRNSCILYTAFGPSCALHDLTWVRVCVGVGGCSKKAGWLRFCTTGAQCPLGGGGGGERSIQKQTNANQRPCTPLSGINASFFSIPNPVKPQDTHCV